MKEEEMKRQQYLGQLYRLNELIESNKRELVRLRRMSASLPGCDFEERGRSGNAVNRLEKEVGEIVDLEREIAAEIAEYMQLEKEIRAVIGRQENHNERLLLRLRYIEFMTWDQIADKMSYSNIQVYRIHKKALENLKTM